MNLTLHLTENCNMSCDYCIRNKRPKDMSEEVLRDACDMIFESGVSAGFSFFGGEPLLKKDLIYLALDICKRKSEETGKRFSCRMTTNGILLDDEFLKKAKEYNLGIGLSFDGTAQDICRHMAGGGGSYDIVLKNAKKLIEAMPGSYAMLTIAPQAADKFLESVKHVYRLGFRRITATIALGKNVSWTEESMDIIEQQLWRISEFYQECYHRNDKFFFSPFDGKIIDALTGKNSSDRCHLGLRQMPVAPDGRLYACTQFIGDEDYCLGDVFNGLDKDRQLDILKRSAQRKEPEDCSSCDLRNRCTHTCGCSNRMETGNEDMVSAVQCNYERIVITTADNLADILYNNNPDKFKKIFLK